MRYKGLCTSESFVPDAEFVSCREGNLKEKSEAGVATSFQDFMCES